MELREGIQEVVTEEVLSYFNSSSSTERPSLGNRAVAEFSKKVSSAVVEYLNLNASILSAGIQSTKTKERKRTKDTSGSEKSSDENSEVGASDSSGKATGKGVTKKAVSHKPSLKIQPPKKERSTSPAVTKKASDAAPSHKAKASKEVLLAKSSKGLKRSKGDGSSQSSEDEENNSSDNSDDGNDADFYASKAARKGRTKKMARQKVEAQQKVKKSSAPVPPRPFTTTQIVKDTPSLDQLLKPANPDMRRSNDAKGSNKEDAEDRELIDEKKILPVTYRDISHITNDQGKRRKLSPSARNRLEDEAWEKYFAQLIHWHEQHGTYNVPFQAKVEDDEHVYLLYEWLRLQHTCMSEYYSFDPAKYQQLSELMEKGLWTEDTGGAAASSSSTRAIVTSSSSAATSKSRDDTPSSPLNESAGVKRTRTGEINALLDACEESASLSSAAVPQSPAPPNPTPANHQLLASPPRLPQATHTVDVSLADSTTRPSNKPAIVATAANPLAVSQSAPIVRATQAAPRSASIVRPLTQPPLPTPTPTPMPLPTPTPIPTPLPTPLPTPTLAGVSNADHSQMPSSLLSASASGLASSSTLQMLKPKLLPVSRSQGQLPPRSVMLGTPMSVPVPMPVPLPMSMPISKPLRPAEQPGATLGSEQELRVDNRKTESSAPGIGYMKADEVSQKLSNTNKTNLLPSSDSGSEEQHVASKEAADEKVVATPKIGLGMPRKSVAYQRPAVLSQGTGTDSDDSGEEYESQGEESEVTADGKVEGSRIRHGEHMHES